MEKPTQLPDELTVILTIRFSAAIEDLLLEIPSPSTTTGAGLKQLIRAKLPSTFSARRLRLIYSGKALDDQSPLTVSLKIKSPGSRSAHDGGQTYPYNAGAQDEETYLDPEDKKGKTPMRDDQAPSQVKNRIYIHCSIGDIVLDDSQLAEEENLAVISPSQHHPASGTDGLEGEKSTGSDLRSGGSSSTTEAPRGFDRLLSAGFTVGEVSALRSQFLALQSLTHTPDTMPSGEELRQLEDRWMDEGSTRDGVQDSGTAGGGGITNDDGGGGFGSGSAGGLDDMIQGSVMGFFWPIGCALWLLREEGVWTWRKGLAVFVGVVVNFGFGAIRAMN